MCSPACAEDIRHRAECAVLAQDVKGVGVPSSSEETPRYDLILILRLVDSFILILMWVDPFILILRWVDLFILILRSIDPLILILRCVVFGYAGTIIVWWLRSSCSLVHLLLYRPGAF